MASDDLNAPLKARVGRQVRLPVSPLNLILGLGGVVALAAIVAMQLAGDPRGGEPSVEISLVDPPQDTAESADPEPALRRAPPDAEAPVTTPAAPEPTTAFQTETTEGGSKVIIIRPEARNTETLAPVPDSRLVERTPAGLLPKRADDGSVPMTVYARPSTAGPTLNPGDRPRVAILVNGMGLNSELTTTAINRLPGEVTLSFAPYGSTLQDWVSKARRNGHEVMLQVPMEPFDFPDNDPGPHTLLTSLTPAENLERLHWVMSRFVGYTGLTNYMGARFTASREVLRPMLLELKKRGLFYLEDGTSPRSLASEIATEIQMPVRTAHVVLDAVPAPDAIAAAINRLEIEAHRNGFAIGVISALPVSVTAIAEWAEHLEAHGLELVPVSATLRMVAEG